MNDSVTLWTRCPKCVKWLRRRKDTPMGIYCPKHLRTKVTHFQQRWGGITSPEIIDVRLKTIN